MAALAEQGKDVSRFDTPAPPAWVEWYAKAFYELSTCRQVGMGLGPIPWSETMRWAERHGLDRDEADELWDVLSIADQEYLKNLDDKAKQDAKRREAQQPRQPEQKALPTRRRG